MAEDISVSDVSVSDVSVSDVSVSDSESEGGGGDAETGGAAEEDAGPAVAVPAAAAAEDDDDDEEEEDAAVFRAGRPALDLGVAEEEEGEVVEARAVLGSERGEAPEALDATGIDLIDRAAAAVRREPAHLTEDAVRFREFKVDQLEFWAREMVGTPHSPPCRGATAPHAPPPPPGPHVPAHDLSCARGGGPAEAAPPCRIHPGGAFAATLPRCRPALNRDRGPQNPSKGLAQCLPCGQRRQERKKGFDNPALKDMPSPQVAALQLRERARVAYGGLLFLLREDPFYLSRLLRLQHAAVRQQHFDVGEEPLLSRAELSHVSRIVTTVLFGTKRRRTISGGAAVSSVITPGGDVLPEAAALEEEVVAEGEEDEGEGGESVRGDGGKEGEGQTSGGAEGDPAPGSGGGEKARPAFLLPVHDERVVQAHLEDLTTVNSGTPRVALAPNGGATLHMGSRGAERLTRLQSQIRRSITSAQAAAVARSAVRGQERARDSPSGGAAAEEGDAVQQQQQEEEEQQEGGEDKEGGGEDEEEGADSGASGADHASKVSELELLFAVTADVHLLHLCKDLLVDEIKVRAPPAAAAARYRSPPPPSPFPVA